MVQPARQFVTVGVGGGPLGAPWRTCGDCGESQEHRRETKRHHRRHPKEEDYLERLLRSKCQVTAQSTPCRDGSRKENHLRGERRTHVLHRHVQAFQEARPPLPTTPTEDPALQRLRNKRKAFQQVVSSRSFECSRESYGCPTSLIKYRTTISAKVAPTTRRE